jgi:hypothetical protein
MHLQTGSPLEGLLAEVTQVRALLNVLPLMIPQMLLKLESLIAVKASEFPQRNLGCGKAKKSLHVSAGGS